MRTRIWIYIILIFSGLLLCVGCGETPPPAPPQEPEITVDISGAATLKFEFFASISMTTLEDFRQLNFSGYSKVDGKDYGIVISLFYHDSLRASKTYKFYRSQVGLTDDFAVAAFIIGKEPDKIYYLSDSGEVRFELVSGKSYKGNFFFYSDETEQGLGEIQALNGIIDVNR
jgi:hypothetical protein